MTNLRSAILALVFAPIASAIVGVFFTTSLLYYSILASILFIGVSAFTIYYIINNDDTLSVHGILWIILHLFITVLIKIPIFLVVLVFWFFSLVVYIPATVLFNESNYKATQELKDYMAGIKEFWDLMMLD